MVTIHNPNPTLYPWENEFLENLMFLNIFKKLRYDSQNQIQSNSIDVSKGLESSNIIKYIKRISLDDPDRFPMPRTPKTWVSVPVQLATTSSNSPSELHHNRSPCSWVFLSGNPQISHQNPNFDPLDPKFDPKTCTLIYKHQKAFKTTTNIES